MCHHPHRVIALGKRLSVSTNIYAISQTAHHEHLRTKTSQLTHKTAHEVLPVGRAAPCANDAHHSFLIQRCRPLIVEHQRSVSTFEQTTGIVVVAHHHRAHAHALSRTQFVLGIAQRLANIVECLCEAVAGIWQQVANVLTMGHYLLCRPYAAEEFQQFGKAEIANAGECNSTDYFLLVHGYGYAFYVINGSAL